MSATLSPDGIMTSRVDNTPKWNEILPRLAMVLNSDKLCRFRSLFGAVANVAWNIFLGISY